MEKKIGRREKGKEKKNREIFGAYVQQFLYLRLDLDDADGKQGSRELHASVGLGEPKKGVSIGSDGDSRRRFWVEILEGGSTRGTYLCCSGEREAVASLNSFGVGMVSNINGIFKWSLFWTMMA